MASFGIGFVQRVTISVTINASGNAITIESMLFHGAPNRLVFPVNEVTIPIIFEFASCTKNIQNMLVTIPTIIPDRAPALFALFQKRPSIYIGKNVAAHSPKNNDVALATTLIGRKYPSIKRTAAPI